MIRAPCKGGLQAARTGARSIACDEVAVRAIFRCRFSSNARDMRICSHLKGRRGILASLFGHGASDDLGCEFWEEAFPVDAVDFSAADQLFAFLLGDGVDDDGGTFFGRHAGSGVLLGLAEG